MQKLRPFVIVMLVISLLGQSGCTVVYHELHHLPTDHVSTDTLSAGLRVHTVDGQVLIFSPGVHMDADSLYGQGTRYGLNPALQSTYSGSFPRDSVAYMVAARRKTDPVGTTILTMGAAVGVGFTVIVLAFALAWRDSCIYGACS